MRYSLKIALSSLLGALATVISISFHGIPYPIAPFLKIDFSEIIDLLALYIGGWWVGITVATIHFLGLMVNTEYIIGPPMKYIAVLSMYAGIYICTKVTKVPDKPGCNIKLYIATIVSSSIIRALVMIFVNIIVLLFIAPEFYVFFENQLSALTGAEPTVFDVFLYVGYIIGSYNIIQTIFALVPVYILLNIVRRHIHIESRL